MLLRVFRYKTTFDAADAEAVFEAELRDEPEDSVSVYRVEDGCAAQTNIEHLGAAHHLQRSQGHTGKDPPRYGGGVDVGELNWTPTHDDPGGPFAHANAAHHVLSTGSEDDRKRLAEQIFDLLRGDPKAVTRISKEEMRDHVRARCLVGDREWTEFLARPGNEKWAKFGK